METLVATVLIIVVFMVASMVLNNLFFNSIKNDTTQIDAQLNELHYLYINDKLTIPFQDELNGWDINVQSITEKNETIIVFDAKNRATNKSITNRINDTQ